MFVQQIYNKSTTNQQQKEYSKMINKARLRKLKKRLLLIPDFRHEIQSKTKFTLQYIDYVLNPYDKRYNQKIIDAAFEIIKDDTERIEKENQLLK